MTSAELASLTLGPGRVGLSFDPGALAVGDGRADPARSPWSVGGAVDWQDAEALRLISAVFEDGRQLAVAALRTRGADGQDAESVVAHLAEDGEIVTVEAAYISTEYGSDRMPRRLGIEIWTDPERAPLRVAADREAPAAFFEEGVRRESTPMRFRLEGAGGTGLYEVLRAA